MEDEAKNYLGDFVQAIALGNMEQAKQSYDQYIEVRSHQFINEDHNRYMTPEGIDLFLKTLQKRAKKEGKEKEFFSELSKYVKKDIKSEKDFEHCVDHFSEDKKKADHFIHHVEKSLKLEKDDPAKDIKGTGEGE